MEIKLHEIKIRDLVQGYDNNIDTGRVVGYYGNLDIRPPYQREFVYKDKQRDEVIKTISKGFPLNVMYWNKRSDNTYEVLDGQQRTIAICDYYKGKYSVDHRYYHNLTDAEREKFLNYALQIYICSGTEGEKLDWFRTINIAGEKLTNQELRNAVYTGPWLSDAKKKFSAQGAPAVKTGEQYVSGSSIRQEYLETALNWIVEYQFSKGKLTKDDIEEYMGLHQNDASANELWDHYENVIKWFTKIFPTYNKLMKGLPLGTYYKNYLTVSINLSSQVDDLLLDDEVTNKRGIFEFLLSGRTKMNLLSLRMFTESDRRKKYAEQKGICPHCLSEGGADKDKVWDISEMEADHITPWSKGGKTELSNCQMLCQNHNRRKGGK